MKNPNIVEVTFDVSKIKLDKEKEVQLFKELATSSLMDVAVKYGFTKKYKDDNQARASVYQIYRKIAKAPDIWGLNPDTVDVVRSSIQSRGSSRSPMKVNLDISMDKEFINKTLGNIRDKTAKVIEMKIEKALGSKKERDKISLKELATVLSTAVDKGRLLKGESTENVLHYAKLAKDISPENALEILLKGREALIENNK